MELGIVNLLLAVNTEVLEVADNCPDLVLDCRLLDEIKNAL